MQSDIHEEHAGLNALLLKGLRSRVAVNHFKRCILGDFHVAGRAQAKSLFEALEDLALEHASSGLKSSIGFDPHRWLGLVSSRAWEGWFGSSARVPQPGALRGLDQAAARLIRWRRPADDAELLLPSSFYVSLVHGGLLQTMLAPTEAAEPGAELLRSRAANYRPVSAWHLHLDALELRAYSSDFRSVPWAEVVEIASHRILDVLYRLWRPLDGAIYRHFSSNTRRTWAVASSDERMEIRAAFARMKPDLFEQSMVAGASPSSSLTGIAPDSPPVQAHRLLLAIGADAEFLQGDRLSAWTLDLATGGLAAHALAWTDRYRLFGRRVTEEQLILAAFDALLLSASDLSDHDYMACIDRELRGAMAVTAADWSGCGTSALHRARATYLSEISELGLAVTEVEEVSRRAQRVHRLEYVGDARTRARDSTPVASNRQNLWVDLADASCRRQGVGDLTYFSDFPETDEDGDPG